MHSLCIVQFVRSIPPRQNSRPRRFSPMVLSGLTSKASINRKKSWSLFSGVKVISKDHKVSSETTSVAVEYLKLAENIEIVQTSEDYEEKDKRHEDTETVGARLTNRRLQGEVKLRVVLEPTYEEALNIFAVSDSANPVIDITPDRSGSHTFRPDQWQFIGSGWIYRMLQNN